MLAIRYATRCFRILCSFISPKKKKKRFFENSTLLQPQNQIKLTKLTGQAKKRISNLMLYIVVQANARAHNFILS